VFRCLLAYRYVYANTHGRNIEKGGSYFKILIFHNSIETGQFEISFTKYFLY